MVLLRMNWKALFRTSSCITLCRWAVILCAGGRSGARALMSRLMSSTGKTCEWMDVTNVSPRCTSTANAKTSTAATRVRGGGRPGSCSSTPAAPPSTWPPCTATTNSSANSPTCATSDYMIFAIHVRHYSWSKGWTWSRSKIYSATPRYTRQPTSTPTLGNCIRRARNRRSPGRGGVGMALRPFE